MMVKQISFAALLMTIVMGSSLSGAAAFPAFVPSTILAATQNEARQAITVSQTAPASERAPLLLHLGGRSHLFDGYFYCERPKGSLPQILATPHQAIPDQTLLFVEK
ncbi:MAG: hypothetical protein OIF56_08975 [Cohaesibacter sp.]|nr:hypothetical protein [Cohaesibacter sp.]